MAAIFLEQQRGRKRRALCVPDAHMSRRNYLYSLAPERLSTAAAVVAAELKETAHRLIEAGEWSGVETNDDRCTVSTAPFPFDCLLWLD